jgi:hypothetical protein
LLLARFEGLLFCLRWSTTAGAFAVGFGGGFASVVVLLGLVLGGALDGVVAGAGVVVLGGIAGVAVVVVPVFAGSSLGVSLGVVVVTVPSELGGLSAASVPPARGPRPPAVSPLPARAEISARHIHLRGLSGIMRRSWSSCGRPIVVVGADSPQTRGTPMGIHIGRQAPRGKGFVIASTNFRFETPDARDRTVQP